MSNCKRQVVERVFFPVNRCNEEGIDKIILSQMELTAEYTHDFERAGESLGEEDYYVEYWIGFMDFGIKEYITGVFLQGTQENILQNIESYMELHIDVTRLALNLLKEIEWLELMGI